MLVIPTDEAGAARGRFLYFVFMFCVFMMLSPSPPNPYRMMALEQLASREKYSLEALQNATYIGPFEIPDGLNLTGVLLLSRRDLINRQIIPYHSTFKII